jgi:two-component system, OmpR family, sensor histidine kinase VicK
MLTTCPSSPPRPPSLSSTNTAEGTEVFYGEENVVNLVVQFASKTTSKIDACIDRTRPLLATEIKPLKEAFLAAKSRGVKLRYITEITTENIPYCKELMRIVDELRHLDGIKGNFYISDIEYLAPATLHAKGKPASQIIYSNVKEIVEHEQYIFDTLWNRAIAAEEKLKEVEEGRVPERIEVLHDTASTLNKYLQGLCNAKSRWDYYADQESLLVPFSNPSIRTELQNAKTRGLRARVLTAITRENISFCKEISEIVEVRHLDGIKGNFGVTDTDYIAISSPTAEQSIPNAVYSNVKEDIKQQQYVFEILWNKAISGEQKITELEEGIMPQVIEVINDPAESSILYQDILRSSKKEIMLLFPSFRAFNRQKKDGVLDLLVKAPYHSNVKVRLLVPSDKNTIKQVENSLYSNPNIDIRYLESNASTTKSTILVSDREVSLVIELIDDTKEHFIEAIGLSTYSNSKSSVLSYVSIFENLWALTELYQKVKEANEKLEIAYEQLKRKEEKQQALTSSLEKTNEELVGLSRLLSKSYSELSAADNAKEEFMSMVSHELKTPLAPMKLYAEMLLKSTSSFGNINEKQRKAIQIILNNILRLEVLVSDILDVYKLDIGRLKLKKTEVDIEELVNQSVAEFTPLTKDKRIILGADIRTSGTINCDSGRISQVISNLVKNSIDFVPQYDGRIIIRVEEERKAKEEKDLGTRGSDSDSASDSKSKSKSKSRNAGGGGYPDVLFTVEDNGLGIPTRITDNLFKKFYQIDTTATRKHGGTGLGLAISRGLVEAHGGRIWLDKTYTTGTSIKFTLPRFDLNQ